jgi:hypothetical protein
MPASAGAASPRLSIDRGLLTTRINVACPIAKIGQTNLEWTDHNDSSGPNAWSIVWQHQEAHKRRRGNDGVLQQQKHR